MEVLSKLEDVCWESTPVWCFLRFSTVSGCPAPLPHSSFNASCAFFFFFFFAWDQAMVEAELLRVKLLETTALLQGKCHVVDTLQEKVCSGAQLPSCGMRF